MKMPMCVVSLKPADDLLLLSNPAANDHLTDIIEAPVRTSTFRKKRTPK